MELQTLARPYAQAVFELARESGTLEPWSRALAALAAVIREPHVAALVGSPAITREQLADLIGDVLAKAGLGDAPPSAQLHALLRLLADNRRLSLAPVMAERFESLRARAESRVEVEIVTASPDVPQAQRDALETAIGKRLRGRVSIRWMTDAELIGGATIRSGDLVIDGSLRGELQRLSQTLAR